MPAVAGICDLAYTFPREMKKEEYQAKRKVFMDCCRHYHCQVKRRDLILMEKSCSSDCERNSIDDELREVELQMLENNILAVERILTRIAKMYGEEAKELVRRIYVDGETLQKVGSETYMSPRTIKRKIQTYLQCCL